MQSIQLADFDRDALRTRLRKMSDQELREFGKAARYMVSPTPNMGKPKDLCCATYDVCEHIYLHRLRKTCATRWSNNGVSVRTIQAWLGHKSLETTMLYLGEQNSDKLQPNINAAFED